MAAIGTGSSSTTRRKDDQAERCSFGLRIEDFAASGLSAIDNRRLIEDCGESIRGRFPLILSPQLVADPRWSLVLRPQGSSIRNRVSVTVPDLLLVDPLG